MEVTALLRAARRRLRWRRALGAAELAAVAVLAAGLAAQLGTLAVPYAVPVRWVLVAGGAAALAAAVAGYLWRPPGWQETAWQLDRNCGLQDRLVTWVAVQRGLRSELLPHFLQDVARSAEGVRVEQAVPLRLGRWRPLLALMACVLAWDVFLSGATLPHTPAHRVAEAVRREGRRLGELARGWELHARARGLAEALKSARAVQQVAQRLTSPRVNADAAQQDLAALSSGLRQARSRLQGKLHSLGAPSYAPGMELPEQAARALEAELARLGRALEDVSLSPEQVERIQRALERLRGSSPLREDSPVHDALRQARRDLQRGDRKSAREALQRAEEAMRELARLVEEEGALASHQGEVEASSLSIGRAVQGAPDPEAAQEHPMTYPIAGRNRPAAGAKQEDPEAFAWEGPDFGVQPGAGQGGEKLGPATPRLEGPRTPEHLRGRVGAGKVYAARLPGPAPAGEARVPLVRMPARVVRQVDEALRAQRVPAPYREWVRRYFAELARSGR